MPIDAVTYVRDKKHALRGMLLVYLDLIDKKVIEDRSGPDRSILADDVFMYVANEESDTIAKFTVDGSSGKINKTDDVVSTGSPVCIVFRAAD